MADSALQKKFSENIFGLSIPVLALDIVIFTIYRDEFSVLMVERDHEPEMGKFVLPGGIVKSGYSLEENFDDILNRRTEIKAADAGVYKEQLYAFGAPERDTRGHIVSISYYALVEAGDLLKNADMSKVRIVPVSSLTEKNVAFDHLSIIWYALTRVRAKFEYTDVAKNLLPSEFGLSELQKTYETVMGKELDKRNFRKKILSLGILKETGNLDKSKSKRPSKQYAFVSKKGEALTVVEIL